MVTTLLSIVSETTGNVPQASFNQSTTQLQFRLTFDAAMNTNTQNFPALFFPTTGENAGPALTFLSGSWEASDVGGSTVYNRVFVGTYTVHDVDIDIANIDVQVEARDATGAAVITTESNVFSLDQVVPNGTVSVDSITADNTINIYESTATVNITGNVTGETEAGDVVTVYVNGSAIGNGTVQANGSFSVAVNGSDLNGHSCVTVSVALDDAAGNTNNVTDTQAYTVDTEMPNATVTLNNVTADNLINATEANGTVNITGCVSGEVEAGDVVKIIINGTEVANGTVDANLTFSVGVSGALLAADTNVSVTVEIDDEAGNTNGASDSQTYTVNTTLPNATVFVDTVDGDGVINISDANGTVNITGCVSGDVDDGDIVTIVVNNGTIGTGTVTNGTFSVEVNGSALVPGTVVTAVVNITDETTGNANTSNDSASYVVDVTPPTGTVIVDTVTSDGYVNALEANTTINITGNVTGEVESGDAVIVYVNGSAVGCGTIDGCNSFNIGVSGLALASDSSVTVSVVLDDSNGNTNTINGSKAYISDTIYPTATVTVNNVTADNIINASEVAGNVAITGNATGEVEAGDIVTVYVNGSAVGNGTLDANNSFSINVSGSSLNGHSCVTVSVAIDDAAGNGNTASDTQTYTVDTLAPFSCVSVDTIGDGVINASEANGTVNITGLVVGSDVEAGDVVTVYVNGSEEIGQGTVDANGAYSVGVDGADLVGHGCITVAVTVVDAAGNSNTAIGGQSYTVDTTPPTATVIVDSVSDDYINASEANGTVNITGNVSGDFDDGDVVTVSVNGTEIGQGTVNANGTFSVEVDGADLVNGSSVTVSVAIDDAAGNTNTASDSQSYTVDTELPNATVTVDAVSGGMINATDACSTINITGNVAGEVEAGDVVTVYVNGSEVGNGTVDANGSFNIGVNGSALAGGSCVTVSVAIDDAAGNTNTASDTQDYSVDIQLPNATVTVDTVAGGVINAAEANSTINITGTVTGEFDAGDVVTITINCTDVANGTVDANGTFSIAVAGSILAADSCVTATIALEDAAGNHNTASDSQTYLVDVTPPTTPVVNAVEGTGNAQPVITGTGAANSTLIVTVSAEDCGDPLYSATYSVSVNSGGIWSLDLQTAVPTSGFYVPVMDGSNPNQVSAVATDENGNTATGSNAFVVDNFLDETRNGGSANDTIRGGAGDDTLSGSNGDDHLYGNDDDDHLSGGSGADILEGGNGQDSLNGGSANDTLIGGDGTDTIAGSGGNDLIIAGGGDDSIDGGDDIDTLLLNGEWSDYTVTHVSGSIYVITDNRGVNAVDGTETIQNVEQLTFNFDCGTITGTVLQAIQAGPVAVNDTGSVTEEGVACGDDSASGNVIVNDTDINLAVGDVLTVVGARAGTELAGGALTEVDSCGIEIAGTYGTLTISADGDWSYKLENTWPATQALAATAVVYDNFTYGIEDLHGAADVAQLTITVNGANDAPSDPVLSANVVNEFAATNTVVGNLSATDPDTGDTTLTYTLLNDAGGRFALSGNTIVVANGLLLDYEQAGNHSISVQVSDGHGGITVQSIGINVTDVNPENITGTSGADHFVGGSHNDSLSGLAGADTLEGGAGDDTLDGGANNDRLDGGLGADRLRGGAGNDTFIIDNVGDKAYELTGEGTDVVESSVTYSLSGQFIETLTLTGSLAINGTGNAQANTLNGNTGANHLYGLGGSDTLDGGDGNDTLDGGTGADTMRGGLGDDLFIIDEVGDKAYELSGAGNDTVQSSISYNLAGQFIEALVLTGTTAIDATGNALANTLTGNSGANLLSGLGGHDSLAGGSGKDTLDGGEGNDTLDGGIGADTMRGGLGNDLFIINEVGDKAYELNGEGNDTVQSSISYNLAGQFIENLTLTGGDAINGVGNAMANVLSGNSGANLLSGLGGSDSLFGGGGSDTLEGGEGNDTLDGGTGVDSLYGGLGDDVFIIDVAGDKAFELAGEGTDTVYSSVNYGLAGQFIENLVLTGSAAINASGNSQANSLTGNDGANVLTGLGGADNFIFNTVLGGTNIDTVTDFSSIQGDKLVLDDAIFSGLTTGALAPDQFQAGGLAATDATDRIIYDSSNGYLYFDADGVGGSAAIHFATLSNLATLNNSDFTII